MSLKLSANNTSPYQYFSEGDESNPITVSVILDNTGGTKDSSVATAYLVATQFLYTNITVSVVNDTPDIDWKVSLDGTTWADSVNPPDMDARSGDVTTPIYFKAVVKNDGTVPTQVFTTPDVQITYTENP